MTNETQAGMVLLVLTLGLAGCGSTPSPVAPSLAQQAFAQAPPTMMTFTDRATGFTTPDLRDVHDQILQFIAGELIWTADGTRLSGYRLDSSDFGNGPVYFIGGAICTEGCAFEVRFGTKNGERRAYLTADYGHYNPGTLVDVEVAAGALVVTRTTVFPPGTPTLSGVVTEMTLTGPVPLEGVAVYRGVTSGWRDARTDRNGLYRIPGLFDGTDPVLMSKAGYQEERTQVAINGDTRFDLQLVRR